MKHLITGLLGLALVFAAGQTSADTYLDTFSFEWTDHDDWSGEGSGYNDGEWYLYPNTSWINQWFYDGNFRPEFRKEVWISFNAFDASGDAWTDSALLPFQLVVNWTTDVWSNDPDTGPGPPLPGDLTSREQEYEWIGRSIGPLPPSTIEPASPTSSYQWAVHYVIPDYNPEWVSIDIRPFDPGTGLEPFQIDGEIEHTCIPEPTSTVSLTGLAVMLGLAGLWRWLKQRTT